MRGESGRKHGVVCTRADTDGCWKLGMGRKRMSAAVRRAWKWLRPANRMWLCATAGTILALIALYSLAKIHTDRVAHSILGLTFGGLAFVLMLIVTAYSGRKRWRPLVAQRGLGGKRRALRKKRIREERITAAHSAMSELQAEVSRQRLSDRRVIRRRARQILQSAKASRMLRVELEADVGGQIRIWLVEKPQPGSLENWLLAHS